MKKITFQEALDFVELLPEEQQKTLIEIIEHRLIEQRREQIAQNIRQAKTEYVRGECRSGTVDDLMREIE